MKRKDFIYMVLHPRMYLKIWRGARYFARSEWAKVIEKMSKE